MNVEETGASTITNKPIWHSDSQMVELCQSGRYTCTITPTHSNPVTLTDKYYSNSLWLILIAIVFFFVVRLVNILKHNSSMARSTDQYRAETERMKVERPKQDMYNTYNP